MKCHACGKNETDAPEYTICAECLNDACLAEELIDLDELEAVALARASRKDWK